MAQSKENSGKVLTFEIMNSKFCLKRIEWGLKGRKKLKPCLFIKRSIIDSHYMKKALEEAEKAGKRGEVPVGCLLVKSGIKLYAAGNMVEEFKNGLAHAEILALEQASKDYGRYLNDFTMYVSLEPCCMCAGALINARIGRLVFAAYDPERGACGSAFDLTGDPGKIHHFPVIGGVRAEEASKMLKEFFKSRRN